MQVDYTFALLPQVATGSPLRWTETGICIVILLILLTTVITVTTCRGEPVCSPCCVFALLCVRPAVYPSLRVALS
ncbi:MAG: hypothetical protein LBK96_04620 [Prevotellaceae bacterium]|nr:hypothetical protein [Prevotellaceae bacterium]